ncbi:helix-turn-helix domain-containing protein [Promicromonospora sp. NPDC050262]|uniref:ATP-binding protein n=1 Tax=Promicromonospora sp. NPDC050262 TaxID=3155036 RepID=UPI00340F4A46
MTAPFGPYLRSLRQSAGLTIEELSHTSGVSVRAIGDMERGVSRGPQRRTVQALAEALGLDAEQQAELADAARAGRPRTADQPSRRPSSYGLPRGLTDFVGRAPELGALCDLARTASADGPVPVAVVHGAAGLGKTSCAVRAAELLAEEFPDGQVYVDLRGVDPEPMAATEALRRLLLAIGLDPRAIADDEQERAGQLRAALSERRFLVVLDNAADEAQVRPLLPGEGAGMTIVTSRRALGGLDDVARIALAPLSREESAELLRAVSGDVRTEAAPGDSVEAVRVAQLCGHLPLALRIAGTRLASRSGWTMRHLAERLSDEDRRLANLAVGDVGVEAAFALSYLALSERDKRCFRRLALVPAVDLGVPVAAVLTEADPYDAEDELDHLVELGLLQHEGVDRYRFHDLIRLYAGQRLREEETAGDRAAAERRMTDWLLETATVAGQVFEADDEAPPPPRTGLVALSMPTEARVWLEAEQETWLAALRLAAAAERDEQVAELGEALRWYAGDNQQWCREWLEVFGLTRAAAARLPDRRRELWHMNRYAWAFTTADTAQGGTRAREAAEQAMAVHELAASAGGRPGAGGRPLQCGRGLADLPGPRPGAPGVRPGPGAGRGRRLPRDLLLGEQRPRCDARRPRPAGRGDRGLPGRAAEHRRAGNGLRRRAARAHVRPGEPGGRALLRAALRGGRRGGRACPGRERRAGQQLVDLVDALGAGHRLCRVRRE